MNERSDKQKPSRTCRGRTRSFHSCRNPVKRFFCRHHWWQPYSLILALLAFFGTAAGLYRDLIEPLLGFATSEKPSSESGPVLAARLEAAKLEKGLLDERFRRMLAESRLPPALYDAQQQLTTLRLGREVPSLAWLQPGLKHVGLWYSPDLNLSGLPLGLESLELLGPINVAPRSTLPNVKKLRISSGTGLSDLRIPSSVEYLSVRCFVGSDLVCNRPLPQATTTVDFLALIPGPSLNLKGLAELPGGIIHVNIDFSGMGDERVHTLDLSRLPAHVVELELNNIPVWDEVPRIIGEPRWLSRFSIGLVSARALQNLDQLPQGITQVSVTGPRPADFSKLPTAVSSLRWQDRVKNDQWPRSDDIPDYIKELKISLHIGEHLNPRRNLQGLPERVTSLTLEGSMPEAFLGLPKGLVTLDLAAIPYDRIPEFSSLPRGIKRLVMSVGYARSKPVYESLTGLPDGLEELELYGRLMPDLAGLPVTVRSLLIGSVP